MRVFRIGSAIGLTVAALGLSIAVAAAVDAKYHFGRAATEAEIAAWNLDIDRDGKALPPGKGTVAEGEEIFALQCASCHGETGEGDIADQLVGGQGTLNTDKPVKTVGSYWPYAPTLFDYIRRAMPLSAPQSLSNDEVYALSAYILNLNEIVDENAVLDAQSMREIQMPNRDGFVPDPRPDVHK